MRWLTLFYFLAFAGGDLFLQPLIFWFDVEHRKGLISGTVSMMVLDAIPVLPAVFAGAVVRSVVGRLSGFAAGTVGLVLCLVTIDVMYRIGTATDLLFVFVLAGAKFLGPVALAHVPFFRTRALGWPPRQEPVELAGTYAFRLREGEAPASAVARQSRAERRLTGVSTRAPRCWDRQVARLAPPARRVPRSLAHAMILCGRSAAGWIALAVGLLFLAAAATARLSYLTAMERPYLIVWLEVGMLLLGAFLLRWGARRLIGAIRMVRLLRIGRVVLAARQPLLLAASARSIISIASMDGGGVGVETPKPRMAGTEQGLLVDQAGHHVVAWDLLPYLPSVRDDGSLASVQPSRVVPWLAAPLLTVVAAVILAASVMTAGGQLRRNPAVDWFAGMDRQLVPTAARGRRSDWATRCDICHAVSAPSPRRDGLYGGTA